MEPRIHFSLSQVPHSTRAVLDNDEKWILRIHSSGEKSAVGRCLDLFTVTTTLVSLLRATDKIGRGVVSRGYRNGGMGGSIVRPAVGNPRVCSAREFSVTRSLFGALVGASGSMPRDGELDVKTTKTTSGGGIFWPESVIPSQATHSAPIPAV